MNNFISKIPEKSILSISNKKKFFLETIIVAFGAALIFSFFYIYFIKPWAGTDPVKYIGISLMDNERYPGHTNRYMHVYFLKFFIYLAKDSFLGFRLYTSFTMVVLTILTYLCTRDLTRNKNRLAGLIAVLFLFSHPGLISHQHIRDTVSACFVLLIFILLSKMYDDSNNRIKIPLVVLIGFFIFICFKVKEFHGVVAALSFFGGVIYQEFIFGKKRPIGKLLKRIMVIFAAGFVGVFLGQLLLCILDGIFYKDFFWSLDPANWKKQADYVLKDSINRYKTGTTGKDFHTGVSWFQHFLNSKRPVLNIVFILYILSLPAVVLQKKPVAARMFFVWSFPALSFFIMTSLGLKYVFMAGLNPLLYTIPLYVVMGISAAQIFSPEKKGFERLVNKVSNISPGRFFNIFKKKDFIITSFVLLAMLSGILIYFIQYKIMDLSYAWPRKQVVQFFTSESAPIMMLLLLGLLIIFSFRLRPIVFFLVLTFSFFITGFTIYKAATAVMKKKAPLVIRENSYEPVCATSGIVDSYWNQKKKIFLIASDKFPTAYKPERYLHKWHYYIRCAFCACFNKRMESIDCISGDLGRKLSDLFGRAKKIPDFILMTDVEWTQIIKERELKNIKYLDYYKVSELSLSHQRKMYCLGLEGGVIPEYINFSHWSMKKVQIVDVLAANAPDKEKGKAAKIAMMGPGALAYNVKNKKVKRGETAIASVWLWSEEPIKIRVGCHRHGTTKFEGTSKTFILNNKPKKFQVEHYFKQKQNAFRIMLQSVESKKIAFYIWQPNVTLKKPTNSSLMK